MEVVLRMTAPGFIFGAARRARNSIASMLVLNVCLISSGIGSRDRAGSSGRCPSRLRPKDAGASWRADPIEQASERHRIGVVYESELNRSGTLSRAERAAAFPFKLRKIKVMTQLKTGGGQGYLRIATEEGFAPPEMMRMYEDVLEGPDPDPGFLSLMGFYMRSKSERAQWVFDRLQDLGSKRIEDMDARGIDRQIIHLTSPGTQILGKAEAVVLARLANDQLGEACRNHPDRFTGMAACAPQDPDGTAKEIERSVRKYGFRAVIVNSHTHGEYLDNPKFSPILEAAEALGVPIYLHPNTPPRDMIRPMLEAGLDGAVFGFGVETGLHALRLITSGTLDRFPKLQIIIGHLGESLPYQLYRLDFMHGAAVRSKRYDSVKPLKKERVSNYLKESFFVTSSGVAWEPAIKFAQEQIGVDRILYAMDYPYQCPAEEVTALDSMSLSPSVKKMFFQTNAERVFQL
jgi:5-carboxyvanillate decarboxylase